MQKKPSNQVENHHIPGINIQYPWSALVVDGKKLVETRKYPLPVEYLNTPLAVIETPGPNRSKTQRARIVGVITISDQYQYRNYDHWHSEHHLHLVELGHPQFSFVEGTPKWAWVISAALKLPTPIPPPSRRGIVFAKKCPINLSFKQLQRLKQS